MQIPKSQVGARTAGESVEDAAAPPARNAVAPTNEASINVDAIFAEPMELQSVESWFAGRPTRMAVARHNTSGVNRFGQDAQSFPFCLLNMGAWQDCPFDLRVARWFRSEDDAVCAGGVRPGAEAVRVPASKAWSARFAGGIRVELRQEQTDRWVMWVNKDGKFERRKDFATPHLAHGKRTATCWFGTPLTPWSPAASSDSEEAE